MDAVTVCNTPDYCRRIEEVYGYEVRHLTIRAATPEERQHVGTFWATGRPLRAKRWVVVDADTDDYLGAFGMVDGGNSKAEAVFWAERWASKNGGHFIRPAGWEKVVGNLPDRGDR